METKTKIIVSLFIMLTLLVMNITAAELDKTLKLGEVKTSGKKIVKYHYEPGLFCQGYDHESFAGKALKNPSKRAFFDSSNSNNTQKECVVLNKFKVVDDEYLFGQDDDENWYIIYCYGISAPTFMVPALDYLMGLGNSNCKNETGVKFFLNYAKTNIGEEAFEVLENGKYSSDETKLVKFALMYAKKNLGENAVGAHLLFLAEQNGSITAGSEVYKALKKEYPEESQLKPEVESNETKLTKQVNELTKQVNELKVSEISLKQNVFQLEKTKADQLEESQKTQDYYWYGILILVFFVLVLLAIIVHMSTAQDSNMNRKFKVGDQVKVRNTKMQKWRTGVVKQALKVEVDGWQKAHTWKHVEHINKPASESTKSYGKENSETNELSTNTIKKESRTKSTKENPEKSDRTSIRKSSMSENEPQDSNEFDRKTASDAVNHTTEDNTMTSETITKTEETKSLHSTTNDSETNYHSNSGTSTST